MRELLTDCLKMVLIFGAFIALAVAFTPPQPRSTPADNRGNECRLQLRGMFLPCDRLDPRRFTQEV